MIQWLLDKAVRLALYGQGIGAAGKANACADHAALRLLKQNGTRPLVLFDVGANRGDYVQLALKRLAKIPVVIHAFEPSQAAFAELSKRFAERQQIVLDNVALGGEVSERMLHYDVAGSELSSLYPRKIEHHDIRMSGSEQVRVETLDVYCSQRGIDWIDLLKLDVEGHELEVLRGGAEMFKRRQIAMVSFEFGGCNVDSRTFLRDFFYFFADHGMSLARVNAFGGLQPIPRYDEALEQFRTTCFVAISPPS
jgi:FkbM family methyltransferase